MQAGARPQQDLKREIFLAAKDLCAKSIARQQKILESTKRRSKEVKARQLRQHEREAAKREREQKLLEMALIRPKSTTGGEASRDSSPELRSRAATTSPGTLTDSASHHHRSSKAANKPHRVIRSQADLDREAAEARKAFNDAINQRRLENIAKQKELHRLQELEKEKFERDLEQQALAKEEKLLRQELEDKRYHYTITDKIAGSSKKSADSMSLNTTVDAKMLSETITRLNASSAENSRTSSPTATAAARIKELMEIANVERLRRLNKFVDDRWQREIHHAAVQLEAEDRQAAHQKVMEHLELVRHKQLESLNVVRIRQQQEREKKIQELDKDAQIAEKEYLESIKRNQAAFNSTREDEQKRLKRMQQAKLARQREINERVVAIKAKDLEELQRAMSATEERSAQFANEAAEAREIKILSVQKMKYKQYKRDEEERKLRFEQSQRLRYAEELRERETEEKRRMITTMQMQHAGNMLRFRQAQKEALEISLADTEAFYASAQRQRRLPPASVDTWRGESPSRELTARHAGGVLPPHSELRAIAHFARGDISNDILAQVEDADRRLAKLQTR